MREVVVRTGARLHFGLFDLDPASAHQFGGVGMMIDTPGVTVRAELMDGEADTASIVDADAALTQRVLQFVGRIREACPRLPSLRIHVPQFIPSHHGLGSGTQLAIAIGAAISRLAHLKLTPSEIAVATGRGRRSAIGVHGFERGGFIVDGGHSGQAELGTLQRRIAVPEEWRVVLVLPNDTDGLSGSAELQAFRDLPTMPPAISRSLREIVDQHIVPSLQSADFGTFSSCLHEFGQQIGRFFAAVQGGTYRSPIAASIADELNETGPHAVVQSSWGPTVAVFAPNENQANALAASLQSRAKVLTTRPLNRPASVGEVT